MALLVVILVRGVMDVMLLVHTIEFATDCNPADY